MFICIVWCTTFSTQYQKHAERSLKKPSSKSSLLYGVIRYCLLLKIKNWKYCNKIIFKCVNSTVGPNFEVIFALQSTYGSRKQYIEPTKKHGMQLKSIFQHYPKKSVFQHYPNIHLFSHYFSIFLVSLVFIIE